MHALSGGRIIVTSEDGDSQTVEIPRGATFWNSATTHSIENIGDETVRFIRIELK
jgi:oxalate decarboxylase/phosphoglucose isomerase-like protein (cupin superfamily)